MLNKAVALGQTGDPAAEIRVYDALIARYGDSDALQRRQLAASAMLNKGSTLGQTGDHAAALEASDALIARYGDSDALQLQELVARAKISLANRLIDTGVEGCRTEALLKSVTESHKALAYWNLFWLYAASGDLSKARETLPHLQ